MVLDIARFIPRAVIEWLQDYLPGKGLQKARDSEALTSGVARTLIKSKSEALAEGRRGRDILSLLGEFFISCLPANMCQSVSKQ